MDLNIRVSTRGAAVGVQALDLGIAVVDQDALAAGALPDLNFGDDSPVRGWVFRKRIIVEDHTTAGSISPSSATLFLDLKSQRMIGDTELVLIINNSNASGTAFSVHTEGLVRCLFKLP